jgi:hypothetical protein
MRSSQCPGLYLEYCLWLLSSQSTLLQLRRDLSVVLSRQKD